MGEFEFGAPEILWYLFAVPLILLIYGLLLYLRNYKLRRMGNPATLSELMPDYSVARGWLRVVLFALAVGMLVMALAHPRTGAKLEQEQIEGREILLVVDVSNSMMAEDIAPSRMERTRYSITQLVERMSGDAIGVVAFAEEPKVLLPISTEYRTAKSKVKSLKPALIQNQGTNLGKAIEAASLCFTSDTKDKKSRVMIVITDGEAHDARALDAARRAADDGIIICCIGIGTPDGQTVQIDGEYVKDESGNLVVTKLNETLLQEIAAVGDGIYTRSSNTEFGLDSIMARLDEMERAKLSTLTYSDYEEQYQWFVAVALLLLVVEMLLLSRRNPLLRNIRLFEREESTDKR
ncbi:MAG: VWA domain-containing protein [Alistipes sp.]|nr:VWA domain-containing protein [Alistipes sp.]